MNTHLVALPTHLCNAFHFIYQMTDPVWNMIFPSHCKILQQNRQGVARTLSIL